MMQVDLQWDFYMGQVDLGSFYMRQLDSGISLLYDAGAGQNFICI